jgi:hypothetical protein
MHTCYRRRWKGTQDHNSEQQPCESIDKANNIAYWATHQIVSDTFWPPKQSGKKWVMYLWCVRLVEKDPLPKKPDPKPASFWDLSPMPSDLTTLAAIEKFFGPAQHQFGDELSFTKVVADGVDVTIRPLLQPTASKVCTHGLVSISGGTCGRVN